MHYEQYRTLKQAQPNHVLLMEIGDFYHAFDTDAQTLAAVTERNTQRVSLVQRHIETCCVAAAQLDATVHALLQQGYTVAVAQPVSEAERDKPVARVSSDARLVSEVTP